jgi:hypothetical protein
VLSKAAHKRLSEIALPADLFLNGGNRGNSGPNRDQNRSVEVRRNQTLRRRPRRFRVDRSGPSGINPADFA